MKCTYRCARRVHAIFDPGFLEQALHVCYFCRDGGGWGAYWDEAEVCG